MAKGNKFDDSPYKVISVTFRRSMFYLYSVVSKIVYGAIKVRTLVEAKVKIFS